MSSSDEPVRLTFVGCGKAKRSDDDPLAKNGEFPAAALYTSNYFTLKGGYAERMSDAWRILSAKYGVIGPFDWTEPYDVTITDYPLEEPDMPFQTIDEWADSVLAYVRASLEYQREYQLQQFDEIVMLAGKPYLEPLRGDLGEIAAEFGVEVRYPFDETNGIGEQMAWLKEHTDQSAPVREMYANIVDAEDGEGAVA